VDKARQYTIHFSLNFFPFLVHM